MSDRRKQLHVARRAGTSNPVPTAHVYAWLPEGDAWVGLRDGHKPITIGRTKPAPHRRFTPDRGRIIRTLADGQGTVILPPTNRQPRKQGNWATLNPGQFHRPQTNQGVLRADGFKVPKSPSWRQEIAGWSRDYRIERGPPCLFDWCRS